jgi:branched-chain amino acid transport system permease protein/urea transport system permease protein
MAVGVATGIALAFMTLTLGQVLYAQLVLIVGFLVVLKVRGRRLTESTKV